MRKLSLSLGLIVGLSLFNAPPANAETVLQDQVLTSNLNLDSKNSPYRIEGLIQVPKGLTLTIGPGVKVTFGLNGGIKTLGDVFIGAASPSAITEIITNSKLPALIEPAAMPRASVSIVNTKISGNYSSLVYGCGSLSIQDSHLHDFYQLVLEQECPQLSIKNSLLTKVNSVYNCFFDGRPVLFELLDNIIDGMISTGGCSNPDRSLSYVDEGSYKVERNDFRNLTRVDTPLGYKVFSIKENNFPSVKQVRFFQNNGGILNGDLTNNFWGVFSDEVDFRSKIRVIDGKTDVGLPGVLSLFPVKFSPTVIAGAAKELLDKNIATNLALEIAAKAAADKAATELKAKQEADAKAAADKAAAELKVRQEAEAKAAAELKAKQEAEAKAAADKAALTKAQSELTAAYAALADSQKVNREQALRISSLEEQFKVLSESVSAFQAQVSQLNSKLVAALAGQNAANAKLKKICSAKPKPKGC